ncbi:MAG: hypothetical protein V4472_18855 [Pseudomonadota bacterium]
MRTSLFLSATLIAFSIPASVAAETLRSPLTPALPPALREAGCTVRPEHSQSGKGMLLPTLLRCPTGRQVAAAAPYQRGPLTAAHREAGCTARPEQMQSGKTMLLPPVIDCPAGAASEGTEVAIQRVGDRRD